MNKTTFQAFLTKEEMVKLATHLGTLRVSHITDMIVSWKPTGVCEVSLQIKEDEAYLLRGMFAAGTMICSQQWSELELAQKPTAA